MARGPIRSGHKGARILEPNLALLECERQHNYRAGDHDIVIGRVRAFHHGGGAAPLLFYRGGYHRVKKALTSSVKHHPGYGLLRLAPFASRISLAVQPWPTAFRLLL